MQPLLLLTAGAASVGACFGLSGGLVATLSGAVSLPGLVFGLALTTAPALYVGLAICGAPLTADQVASACLSGLRSMGLILFGLAPGLLFLVFSVVEPVTGLRLCVTTVALASLVGVAGAYRELATQLAAVESEQSSGFTWLVPLVFAWATMALGLGYRFLTVVGPVGGAA